MAYQKLENFENSVFDLSILISSIGLTFKINLFERNEFLFCSNALVFKWTDFAIERNCSI